MGKSTRSAVNGSPVATRATSTAMAMEATEMPKTMSVRASESRRGRLTPAGRRWVRSSPTASPEHRPDNVTDGSGVRRRSPLKGRAAVLEPRFDVGGEGRAYEQAVGRLVGALPEQDVGAREERLGARA